MQKSEKLSLMSHMNKFRQHYEEGKMYSLIQPIKRLQVGIHYETLRNMLALILKLFTSNHRYKQFGNVGKKIIII